MRRHVNRLRRLEDRPPRRGGGGDGEVRFVETPEVLHALEVLERIEIEQVAEIATETARHIRAYGGNHGEDRRHHEEFACVIVWGRSEEGRAALSVIDRAEVVETEEEDEQ